jgi:hypothetical protein
MRISVPRQQQNLKKKDTGCPHTRPAAKPRQDKPGHQGLHFKQKEGANENRERENS